jgi:hypothetical protein
VKVKPGVRLLGVKPETVVGMAVVDRCWVVKLGVGFTLTSCIDGAHEAGSLHYAGLAFDCGVHEVPQDMQNELVLEIRQALGAEWDVLLEAAGTPNEHVHCEYQPKTGVQSIP